MTNGSRLLVGTRKGLFTLGATPSGWKVDQVDFPGEPVTAVVHDAETARTWAALGTGHFGVHIWRNDAGSWAEVGAPTYPPRPADATDVNPMTQEPNPWTTMLGWVLEQGARPDELWCGTIPGGLFRSRDGGDSWELERSLWDHEGRPGWFGGGYDWPGIHSVSLDPRDPNTLAVGVSCGGAWVTPDDAATWTISTGMRADFLPPGEAQDPNTQDPHRLVRCAADPDVLWNQHHNGCFRSTDGGRSWVEIEERAPSVFGFAAACHPDDPDTAWFAPAIKDEMRVPVDGQVCVSRTTDGGATFDVLTNGLPGPDAYDLVYRHGLDVDGSGERLAMGSTTGSLWFSGNAGDRWETLNANLPPINLVRFI